MGLRLVSAGNPSPGTARAPVMLARDDQNSLKRTPLHALHVALGGKMVPFAGYEMPV